MNEEHCGSSFDDFLREEGIFEEVSATANFRVIGWQLSQAMKDRGISKKEMAARMQTSRSQVDRILNGSCEGIQLDTLENAAKAVGRGLHVELV